ncbi:hypothetical protein KTE13_30320 [Burkholderia multivorans]|uniref:hypothetical protein n=1 Tax=Burkholderia multivorans TaxID=87883 RepID=UPI001C244215|nr:hypothetical protein [Burkholderia multivorans]MBU9404034.1 hypothetical protein [Burkholderia multivorans]
MKITDDMLTEMEPIVSQWIRERGTCMDGASYAAALELAAYVAASRTTPDRDAIIEECAKVCEMERDALRKNEAVWDANPNLRPDEDYVSEWEASACRGEEYAAAIRTLKTTPTSDKGGA